MKYCPIFVLSQTQLSSFMSFIELNPRPADIVPIAQTIVTDNLIIAYRFAILEKRGERRGTEK